MTLKILNKTTKLCIFSRVISLYLKDFSAFYVLYYIQTTAVINKSTLFSQKAQVCELSWTKIVSKQNFACATYCLGLLWTASLNDLRLLHTCYVLSVSSYHYTDDRTLYHKIHENWNSANNSTLRGCPRRTQAVGGTCKILF